MSSETGSHAKRNVSRRVVLVSMGTFAIGLLFMFAPDLWDSSRHEPGWVAILAAVLAHSGEILASVGLIGLLLELSARRELQDEIMVALKSAFRIDREIADALSMEMRQQIVKTTLSAHLGDNLGPAVFNAVVSRYLEDTDANRSDAEYEITLSEMSEDRTIASGGVTKVFRASEYFAISAEYSFVRMLSHSTRKTLVCVFGDEWTSLIDQFKGSECILRESFPMCKSEKDGLGDALRNNLAGINSVCAVSVKLDRKPVTAKPVAVEDNIVVFDLDITGIPLAKKILHKIKIDGLIAKSARGFPVIVGEPTRAPVLVFNFPPSLHVIPLHFLTASSLFDPEISKGDGWIRISMESDELEGGWVFPNSGVFFTWDMPVKAKPQQLMKNRADRVDLYSEGDKGQS